MTVTNKEIAAGFAAAKKYLWDGKTSQPMDKAKYICLALQKAHSRLATPRAVNDACLLIISSRLGDAYTLDSWLQSQGICESVITDTRMQAHRYAWLNQLIKEFSK